MRRIISGLVAFLALTAAFLVLPVYAAPSPAVEPVEPSIDVVELGSVDDPAPEAVVATDGVPAGPAEESAPSSAPGSSAPGEAPSSGEEEPGVPALTVSAEETDEFSAVGITWVHDDAVTEIVARIRVRADGQWGEWTTLEQDDVELDADAADRTALRDGTAAYFTGQAEGVQAIVQAADGATPRDVQVQLIDPGTSDADDSLGTAQVRDQAQAASTMPAIYSRAQWGADESIRSWDPTFTPTVKAATVHHTADGNGYTADQVPAMMRSIYAYHTVSRGWGDIGYNVIVDKFGRAWEGRYSGSRGVGSPVVGAHAGGFNSYTFGVSMLGNYDVAPTTPAMVDTVAALIAWKFGLYGVDPRGTTQLTSGGGGTSRHAAGVVVTLPTVFGHRDVGLTSCPGLYGYAQLGAIRSKAALLWTSSREPAGSLDNAVGGERRVSVSGWAYDPDQPKTPISVHVYADGKPLAALTADRTRDDVGAVFGVGSAHGYEATLTLAAGTHTVCTYGINVDRGNGNPQLGCRVVTVTGPQPEPRGALETSSLLGTQLRFSGWAFDDDMPSTAIQVHAYADGRGAAVVTADRARADVDAAFGVGAAHGFTGTLNLSVGAHTVCFYAIGVGSGANSELGCRSVEVGAQAHDPVGGFDAASVAGRTVSLQGWAIEPDDVSSSAVVHLYVDGVANRAVTAGRDRVDVAGAFPGVGASHGWSSSFDLPAGSHTVCAYAINLGPGGNTSLGCRTVAVDPRAYDPVGALDTGAVAGRVVTVTGWAIDPDVPTLPVAVHVYADGRPVTAGVAGDFRPDVSAVVDGAGTGHGFRSSFTLGAGSHSVCAYAINVGSGTTNPQLGCRTVSVAAVAWNPIGALDAVTRSGSTVTISGWAFDPDAPGSAAEVHVHVDGVPAAALGAGYSRPDVGAAVAEAGGSTGYSGQVTVSAGSHRVCTYAINVGDGTGNPQLGCRTVTG